MTDDPTSIETNNSAVGGLIVGAFTGLALCGCLVGAAGFAWVMKAKDDARRGWNLVPVVVAAEARPAGAALKMEDISQRAVPEQFVTSSVVKPDSANYIIGQALAVPVAKGEPLLWSDFAVARAVNPLTDKALLDACQAQELERDGPPKVITVESARAAVVGREAR